MQHMFDLSKLECEDTVEHPTVVEYCQIRPRFQFEPCTKKKTTSTTKKIFVVFSAVRWQLFDIYVVREDMIVQNGCGT